MTDMTSSTQKPRFKYFVAGALAALILVIAFQNSSVIETQILFIEIKMRLFFLILTSFGIGMLVGWLLRRRRKA